MIDRLDEARWFTDEVLRTSGCNTTESCGELFDIDLLDDGDPFEIDRQAAHLFKRPHLRIDDVYDVWRSDPLCYPAKPPADWLVVADIAGRVLAYR